MLFKKNLIKPSNLYLLLYTLLLAYSIMLFINFNSDPLEALQPDWKTFFLCDYNLTVSHTIFKAIPIYHPYPPFSYLFHTLYGHLIFLFSNFFNIKLWFSVLILYIIPPLLLTYYIILKSKKCNLDKVLIIFLIFSRQVFVISLIGNSAILTLPLFAFFILYYDSKNIVLSRVAIFALAISFSLKITPIVLGYIYILKKQYLNFLYLFFFSVVIAFFPIFLFKNGDTITANISYMISNIFQYSQYKETFIGGGIIFWYLQVIINNAFKLNFDFAMLGVIVSKILFLVLILITHLQKNEWEQISILSISQTLIGTMAPHASIIFLLPIMFFIANNKVIKYNNFLIFIIFALFTLPLRFYFFSIAINLHERVILSFLIEVCIYIYIIYIIFHTINIFLRNKK